MVRFKKPECPLSYAKCNQTVTVYRADFSNGFSCKKTVYEKAFLDFKKIHNVDKTGSKESNSFLLVIPGKADLKPDDKVLLGEGKDITTREEWGAFIPSKQEGLGVIKIVDPKYWEGEICHVEASG